MATTKKKPKPKRARSRGTAPRNYWHREGPKVGYGKERFRVTVLRGRKLAPVRLDELVENISWEDASAIMTGSISFRRPAYMRKLLQQFPVSVGHQIKLEYAAGPNAAFRELWRMRVSQPSREVRDGTVGFELANDLTLLQGSEDDFRYVKGKTHKRGWLGHQIIADVARKSGLKIRRLPRMKHRITKMVKLNANPLDVIVAVLQKEKVATGRRFAIYFERGKLEIKPLRRSDYLLIMGNSIINLAVAQQMKENFATAVTVRTHAADEKGRDEKNHKTNKGRKIVVRVRNKLAVARYGYIHRVVFAQDVTTRAQARAQGRRWLARLASPKKEATLSHPAIPWLRRLQAIRLDLPEEGLKQIVYVAAVRYEVAGGTFNMELTLTFDDPYVDTKALKVTEDLVETAKKRQRKKPSKQTKKRPVTKKHKNRSTDNTRPPVLGQTPTPVKGKK